MRGLVRTAVLLILSGCAPGAGGARHAPLDQARAPIDQVRVQEGVASWYGPGFHGKPTASGEIYDQNQMTAAHQRLPLGTVVAVTNLANGRTAEVRINDRGPFVGERILDLSHAAAQMLGILEPGTAPVRIEVLNPIGGVLAVGYAVQVGAFAELSNAERLRASLAGHFDDVYISPLDGPAGRYFRVRVGRFPERPEAEARAHQAAALGLPVVIVEDGGIR